MRLLLLNSTCQSAWSTIVWHAILLQILAEIGVNLDQQLVAAPAKQRIQQAQQAQQEMAPQAMGATAGGGSGSGGGGGNGSGSGGGMGGGDSGLDDDLQARLDRLRKT